MILIVTAPDDESAPAVETILRQRGTAVSRFDPADFPSEARITVAFADGRLTNTLSTRGRSISIDEVSAVWYRRPGRATPSSAIKDPNVKAFVAEHSQDFLNAFWEQIECAWLPGTPATMRAAQQKAQQWRRAARLGFEVPPTQLTNDPQHFLDFYREQNGKLISKSSGNMSIPALEADGKAIARYTEVVTTRDTGYAQDIALCPIILQAYVPKRMELRITVVGSQVFAAEIHSQATTRTQHDWRRYHHGVTPYRPHDLPDAMARRCVELVSGYGLVFGAIDLILTPDGRYVFLELNSSAEYGWIEDLTGLPISHAIADLLYAYEKCRPSHAAVEAKNG